MDKRSNEYAPQKQAQRAAKKQYIRDKKKTKKSLKTKK